MFARWITALAVSAAAFAANPTQPSISSAGVVNAASSLAPGFSNSGIAQGSIFVIYGSYLGPDTLTQAGSFPLPTSAGLAGTLLHLNAGAYNADIPIIYTSASQVAALMPSTAPLGNVTLTLTYRTLTSNPVVINVVRSSFGIFTLNQGGTGQAIVQNYVNPTLQPVNTILAPASPGGVGILWGTGLGPVASGDEAAGPIPGSLASYLDALYVGGQKVNVRYAGRTSCCAGVDQINFDIPAGIQGCYVPISAVVNGLVSNVATIAIGSGSTCSDPLSFNSSDLTTLSQTGALSVGTINYWNNVSAGAEQASATFLRYATSGLTAAPAPLHATAGSCYETQSPVGLSVQTPAYGTGLNAGFAVSLNGPPGRVDMTNNTTVVGSYSATVQPPLTFPGAYSVTSIGGADIGVLSGSFTAGAPLAWTNSGAYNGASIPVGQTLPFTWTPGDANTYVQIGVLTSSATLSTSIVCDLPSTLGSFTIPDYLVRTILPGSATISFGSFTVQHGFSGDKLGTGIVTAGTNTSVTASFRN